MRFLLLFSLVQLFFSTSAFAQVEIKCGKALEQSIYAIREAREVYSGAPFEFNCEVKNNQKYSQTIKSIQMGSSECEEVRDQSLDFLTGKSSPTLAKDQKYKVRLKCKFAGGIGPYKNSLKVVTGSQSATIMRKGEQLTTSTASIEANLKNTDLASFDQPGNCGAVDMFKKGGSMEFVPPTFQLTGNCFAQQASQLYDAYRFKNGTNNQKLSSPSDIALTYWLKTGARDFNGGTARVALNQILDGGSCPRQFFDANLNRDNFYRKYDKDEVLLSEINDITAKYKKIMNESKKSELNRHMQDFNCEMTNLGKQYAVFSNVSKRNLSDLRQILDFNSKEKNSVPLTMKLLKDDNILLCSKDDKLKALKPYKVVQHYSPRDRNKMLTPDNRRLDAKQIEIFNAINKELDKGSKNAMPLGISICSNVFNTDKACGGHATVLTGRRFNAKTQKCEYKIRTHWSNVCKGYLYKNVSECNPNTGEIWTESHSFLQAVDRVIQLAPK